MHRFSRIFLAFLLFAGGSAFARPCPSAEDLAATGSEPGAQLAACVELASFTVATGRGPVNASIYGNPDADPELVARLQAGLIGSGTTLQSLGPYTVEPIDVYISPTPYVPGPDGGSAAATTQPSEEYGPGDPKSCVIAVFEGVYGWPTEYLAAHEFFHCVQYNEFGDHMLTERSAWWFESSADWFSSLAFQGLATLDFRVAEFDARSPTEPLTGMTYANVVFFWWVSQELGPLRVMDIIANTATGAGSQEDALASSITEGEFLKFVKDYLDRKIYQPGGRSIPSTPVIDLVFRAHNGGRLMITAPRFVVYRADLRFDCGEWHTKVMDTKGKYATQRWGEEEWEKLPTELPPNSGSDIDYLLAGAATAPEGFLFDFSADRDDCSRCVIPENSTGPAACLVGEWQLTSGGMGAQIGEMLGDVPELQGIDYPDLDNFLTLNRDGTFVVRTNDGGEMQAVSNAGEVFNSQMQINMERHGTWSIDGDRFEQCFTSFRDVEIEDTAISPQGVIEQFRATAFQGARPSYTTSRQFSCSDGVLSLTERALFAPDVTWVYEK